MFFADKRVESKLENVSNAVVCEPKRRTTFAGSLQFPNRFSGNFWVLSIMPKILEISVGIQVERFVSVSFDRTMRDQVTSGGGPRISVKIFRLKFSVALLINRFFGPN